MRRLPFLFLALLAVPRSAWAQGAPLGPEFRVNTYTTGNQDIPSVAADASGNFVVVWTSDYQDGASYGIFGQRYASAGNPLGPEFRVNTYTTNSQAFASVATDPSGNFVVAWNSFGQSPDTSGYSVIGQRYASSGAPLGSEFRVNTITVNSQYGSASSASALPTPAPPKGPSSASTPSRRTSKATRRSPPTPPATSSSSGRATGRTDRTRASSASATARSSRWSCCGSA